MIDSVSRPASSSTSSSLRVSSSAAALVTRSPDLGRRLLPVAYALSLVLAGCSSDDPGTTGAGGSPAASGGMSSGGSAMASGGSPSANGGSTTTGGTPGVGGSATATGGTGGTGGGTPVAPIPPAPACVTQLIMSKCTTAPCHAPGGFFGGADLTGDFLTKNKDKKPTYVGVLPADMGKCKADAFVIDSARPSQSVLLKKVLGTQDCGVHMPLDKLLPIEEQNCFSAWLGGSSGGAGGGGGTGGSGGSSAGSGGTGGATAGSGGAAGGSGGATAGAGGSGGKGGSGGSGGATAGAGGGGAGSGGASAGSGGSGGASAGTGGGGRAG